MAFEDNRLSFSLFSLILNTIAGTAEMEEIPVAYSGGHKGYSLHTRPRKYRRTKQQQTFADALEFCGIKKGISKRELMEKMRDCIPEYYRQSVG